jgi:hypothetical protein
MNRAEALEIIDRCKGWNSSQRSWSLASGGPRMPEDDLFDARRETLTAAWLALNSTAGVKTPGENQP